MRAQADRSEDKRYLKDLSDSLSTSYNRIRLDECGDWNIFGKRGKISTETKYWYLFLSPETKRHWSNVKNRLKFMTVHIDGDDEGILKLSRMPTEKEAEKVRKELQMRKRTEMSDAERELLKIRFKSSCRKGL